MNLGARIAELRKKKGATQEQLANFTNVSIAAVSKWETDSSLPDILLLPQIAKFFEVSIDMLLDYDVTIEDIKLLQDINNHYISNKDYQSGIPIYEEAIRRYPNDFYLNNNLAQLYLSKASNNWEDKSTCERALNFFEKAIILHNDRYVYNISCIYQQIAFIYGGLGEYEKAIDILTNKAGKDRYVHLIAEYMIRLGKYEEAKEMLQLELNNMAFNFGVITNSLGKCFDKESDIEAHIRILELNAQFRENFAGDLIPNYFNYISSIDYYDLAYAYKESEKYDRMWAALEKSVSHAVLFDMEPSYTGTGDVVFFKDFKVSFSNSSSTNACGPLLHGLKDKFNELKLNERYLGFIKQLETTQSNKKQCGLWEVTRI